MEAGNSIISNNEHHVVKLTAEAEEVGEDGVNSMFTIDQKRLTILNLVGQMEEGNSIVSNNEHHVVKLPVEA
nr:unnamed protein product [Digitaria exilis]